MSKKKKSLLRLYSQAKFSKNFVIVAGLLIVAGLYFVYSSYAASPWKRMADIRGFGTNPPFVKAVDIGSGGGRTWAVGADGQVVHFQGGRWNHVSHGGAGVRVDVDQLGQPWKVVWNTGNVYFRHRDSGEWHKVFSGAVDVGISSNGIGYNLVGKNKCLYRLPSWSLYSPAGWTQWSRITAVPCNVSTVEAYNGAVYWVNTSGKVYGGSYKNGKFVTREFKGDVKLKDVAMGYGGRLWALGGKSSGNQYVYQWSSAGWRRMPGGIVRMTVDNTGLPMGVNSSGYIYLYDPD